MRSPLFPAPFKHYQIAFYKDGYPTEARDENGNIIYAKGELVVVTGLVSVPRLGGQGLQQNLGADKPKLLVNIELLEPTAPPEGLRLGTTIHCQYAGTNYKGLVTEILENDLEVVNFGAVISAELVVDHNSPFPLPEDDGDEGEGGESP